MKKVLIIDDHTLARKGLKLLLDAEADLSVYELETTASEALRTIDKLDPDLVVIDTYLRGMSGIELIEKIHKRKPAVGMLVCTEDTAIVGQILKAGALGFITKHEAEEELMPAIQRILDNKHYLSDEACHRVIAELVSGPSLIPEEVLSKREMEVFQLTGLGKSTRHIAQKLEVSTKTVDSFRRRIKKKLKLENNNALIQSATQWTRTHGNATKE